MTSRNLLLILACAGGWFGFANPLVHIPPAVALFPASLFLLGRQSRTMLQAARFGWLAGTLTFCLCLYWIVFPVHNYGHLPWVLAVPCPILISMALGLYTGVFAIGAHFAAHSFSWPLQGLFCGLLWACLEFLRSILFTGFPWLTLSQALAPFPVWLQSASLVGAFGLSGLLVAISVWAVHTARFTWALALAATGVLALLLFGLTTLKQDSWKGDSDLQAAIVQGNIDQNRKWNPAYQNATLETYLQLSRKALQAGPLELLIWPETALPFYLQDNGPLQDKVLEFCKTNQVSLLTGAPAYSRRSPDNFAYFNRTYLIDDSGTIADHYDKAHLVPFGEYVPFRRFLPWIGTLVAQIADFTPGQSSAPLTQDSLALGVLICYEIIFPDLVQNRVEAGANLLINQSNDAWFGNSSAPEQHLHLAVLRAVEQRRTILRATNTGISAVIDPLGRIQKRTGLFVPATLVSESALTVTQRTLYSRHSQKLHLAFFLLTGLMIGYSLWTRKKASSHKPDNQTAQP